eukprot:gene4112-7398_t
MEVNQLFTNSADVVSIFLIDVIVTLFCLILFFLLIKRLKFFKNLPTGRKTFKEIFTFHTEKHYDDLILEYGATNTIYFWFLKNIIQCFCIITLLGIFILLPLHLTGKLPNDVRKQFNQSSFKQFSENFILLQTTISMVASSHLKLYVHVILIIIFTMILLFFLNRFFTSKIVQIYLYDSPLKQISNYTIKVKNLPFDDDDFPFELYFDEIEKIERIKDLRSIKKLERKHEKLTDYIDYFQYFPERTFTFSNRKCYDYYIEKKHKLEQKIKECNEIIKNEVFIVFKYSSIAKKYLEMRVMKINSIKLLIEPVLEPNDIQWNFMSSFQRYYRVIMVNIALLLIILYYSSPLTLMTGIMGFLNTLPYFNKKEWSVGYIIHTSNFIFQYFSTLILVFLSFFIPGWIIPSLTKWERRNSKSEIKRVIQIRNFICLILSSLIIPAMLLTTIDEILIYLQYQKFESIFIRMFNISSGSFFISYLIQYSLIGNSLDLLRLNDIFFYLYKHVKAKTPREMKESIETLQFDSFFEYSFNLSNFLIVICFSVLSPLVLPLGLFFFIFKYFVDHQKVTYSDEKDISQVKLLIQLILVIVLIFQLMMIIFFIKTVGILSFHVITLLVLFLITGLFCYGTNRNLNLKKTEILFDEVDSLHDNFSKQEIEHAYESKSNIYDSLLHFK